MQAKNLFTLTTVAALTAGTILGSAPAFADDSAKLSLAYQYGLAYAPALIAQQEGYIEEAYKEATGKDVEITWNQMSSGADINTGIASGELSGGFMGLAPAITGVMKGVGYRVFSNLSGQRHGLMTNDPSITSLGDLVESDRQIALVNIGSIQHILLAKALTDSGFDAHALDANIVAMAHPDGMTALESGSVSCHLTSSPYIFMELENDTPTELPEVNSTWTDKDSFIVGVASEELKAGDPDLYKALCDGISRGIDLINSDPEAAAELIYELDGNTLEDELAYMKLGSYSVETSGIFEIATFMAENGFLEAAPASYEDLVFENVKGD